MDPLVYLALPVEPLSPLLCEADPSMASPDLLVVSYARGLDSLLEVT